MTMWKHLRRRIPLILEFHTFKHFNSRSPGRWWDRCHLSAYSSIHHEISPKGKEVSNQSGSSQQQQQRQQQQRQPTNTSPSIATSNFAAAAAAAGNEQKSTHFSKSSSLEEVSSSNNTVQSQNINDKSAAEHRDVGASLPSSTTLKQLWSILQPEHSRVIAAVGALLVSSTTTLAMPRLLGLLVDKFGALTTETSSAIIFPTVTTASMATQIGLDIISTQSGLVMTAIVIGALASGVRLFLLESASERIAYRLRIRLFESLMKKKMSSLEQMRTGEQINRLSGSVTITARVLLDLSFGLRNILTAIVGTLAIFMIVPAQLVGTLIAPVAGIFVFGMVYGKFVRRLSTQKQDRLAETAARAEEKLGNIQTVRFFNGEILEVKEYEKEMSRVYAVGSLTSLAIGGRSSLFYGAGCSLLLHLIYRCGILISTGTVSLGDVTSLVLYVMMTGASYQGIITAYGDIQKALGACQRVIEIIQNDDEEEIISKRQNNSHSASVSPKPSNADALSPQHLLNIQPSCSTITFDNVWFSYPARPDQEILQGFSLEVPERSVVAIVGESGSGKSTLTSLLMRLYEPHKGTIRVGDVDIKDYPPAWVRSHIGVVNQEPVLFATTIKENILYGLLAQRAFHERIQQGGDYQSHQNFGRNPFGSATCPNVDLTSSKGNVIEKTLKSLKKMNLRTNNAIDSNQVLENEELQRLLDISNSTEFVGTFPDGVNTCVGERGLALSGGQKQRICIARALAKKPKLLVLDEATSALDTRSEILVHQAVSRATQDATTILITHRLSTLSYSDYIAVMSGGKLAQFGPRSEVLTKPCPELHRILAGRIF